MAVPRSVRRVLLPVAVALAALAVPHGAAAAPVLCGSDGYPACPSAVRVDPTSVPLPVHDAVVTVFGTDLGGVAVARLQPGGIDLPISARTDTSLKVRLPEGLARGGYRIEVLLAGQVDNIALSPFIQVEDPSAPGPTLPVVSFAPVVAAPPAPAAATASAPPAAPAAASSSGIWGVRWLIMILAVGIAGGGVAGAVLAYRRRRGGDTLHEITLSAMDRKLEAIWAHEERRTRPFEPSRMPPIAPQGHHNLTGVPARPAPAFPPPRYAPASAPPLAATPPPMHTWSPPPASATIPAGADRRPTPASAPRTPPPTSH